MSHEATPQLVARAPGKLVLSGAYSVLWGAPCLVAAVDRFAVADRARVATHISEEAEAAIALGLLDRPCFVDVSDLRAQVGDDSTVTRKLGLGSSAAIIVATMAAARAEQRAQDPNVDPRDIDRDALFRDALLAHRTAQKGGSGVDVAASVFGGVLRCRLADDGAMSCSARPLPSEIQIHVYSSMHPASTQGMVARVRVFERDSPARFADIIRRARASAERVADARDSAEFLAGLHAQDAALRDLAREAAVPIFGEETDTLREAARREGAFFGPSGAGGGDIAIFVSDKAPGDAFATALASLEVEPLQLGVGASGVRIEAGRDHRPA